jgi:hypothetical protein
LNVGQWSGVVFLCSMFILLFIYFFSSPFLYFNLSNPLRAPLANTLLLAFTGAVSSIVTQFHQT